MNYYQLKPAVGTKETGNKYPAIESPENYDFKSDNSAHRLSSDSFPDFNPDLRFNLAWGARMTDIMSQATISAHGLIISNKVFDILKKYSSIPYKIYDVTINAKGKKEKYFWIHFVWTKGVDLVDYKRSKWQIKRASRKLGEIELASREEHLIKQGELGFIDMIHGYLVVIEDPLLDIFIDPINFGIFISERVRNELERNDIRGAEILINKGLEIKN